MEFIQEKLEKKSESDELKDINDSVPKFDLNYHLKEYNKLMQKEVIIDIDIEDDITNFINKIKK